MKFSGVPEALNWRGNSTRHTITLTIHTIAPHTTHDYPTRHTIAFDYFTLKMQKSLDGEHSNEAFEFYSDKAIVCL